MSTVHETRDSGEPSLSPRIEATTDSAPRRILIADDDPAMRRLFEVIAKRERIEADVATNGAEAIRALRHCSYSLLFLDIMMPRVDGWGVLDFLRMHARDRHPAIFVITAFLDQALSTADREIVSGILYKPVDADDIAALMREHRNGGTCGAVLHRTRHRFVTPA